MKLHNLTPARGSVKTEKRIGRGEGSGRGGTSSKKGFEGGQMPLQRRVPKFGFKNVNRVEYKALNLATLQALSEKHGTEVFTVDPLIEAGLISKNDRVKILGNGPLTAKLDITAHAFSKSAIAQIEEQQGKATII